MNLTEVILHHPDLKLNEAVSIEAVVFSHAAVADFMATKIKLALAMQGSDFGVTHCVLLQNVDQAPKKQKRYYNAGHHPLILLKHSHGLVCFGGLFQL